jgi:hypothetical protein
MAVRRWVGIVALLVGSVVCVGQEPSAAPVPGTFRAFIVTDFRTDPGKDARNRTGRMHDLVTENGLNPVLAIFSRTTPEKADVPLARLILRANSLVTQFRADRFGAYVIFLTLTKEYPDDDQRKAKADAVDGFAKQVKASGVPFGLAAGAGEAATKFGLKEGQDLTVVFYHRMKVVKTWSFTAEKPPTDDEIKQIEAAVAAEIKK